MMKTAIENVSGFEGAIKGMRYPLNSDEKFDSSFCGPNWFVGPSDLRLLCQLAHAGPAHRKALRMIHVQATVNMTMSWWTQFDTYKVATTANSRSRMHRFGSVDLTADDFYVPEWDDDMEYVLRAINVHVKEFRAAKEAGERERSQWHWHKALTLLPLSYLQERLVDMNYEHVISMMELRWDEKLRGEWRHFLGEMLKAPYMSLVWAAVKAPTATLGILRDRERDGVETAPAEALEIATEVLADETVVEVFKKKGE